ncbi:MAG TPA: tetratricopeptide repeat protein [Polyangiaceae bacterium]|jgi:tetratricopeptide (TPR) repeat protein|nr:tetratricopeptide repeat protein [Polyangiaceae bacterium]
MDERLKSKLVMAKEHFERREFEHAEPLLLQILEKNDRFADVLNMLGIVRHERGDFVGAKDALERAVGVNPSYTEALLNLVVVMNDLGDYDGARAIYERVRVSAQPSKEGAAADPYALGKIANMHADVAKAYADAGYGDEAVAELKKAVALRPGFADLHLRLGSLLRDRGDLAGARDAFEAATNANASYPPALVQLGVTKYMMDDKVGAAEAFARALELDPENKVAKMHQRLLSEKSD